MVRCHNCAHASHPPHRLSVARGSVLDCRLGTRSPRARPAFSSAALRRCLRVERALAERAIRASKASGDSSVRDALRVAVDGRDLEHVGAGRSRVGRAPHDHWLACRCAQPWPTSPNLRKVCAVPRCTAIVVGERSEHWHPGPAPPVSTWPAASGPPGAEAAGIELAPPPPAVPGRGCQRQLASGPAGTATVAVAPVVQRGGAASPRGGPGPGRSPRPGRPQLLCTQLDQDPPRVRVTVVSTLLGSSVVYGRLGVPVQHQPEAQAGNLNAAREAGAALPVSVPMLLTTSTASKIACRDGTLHFKRTGAHESRT
jgi:hypothetical protein